MTSEFNEEAKAAADAIGVTPYSDMRLFVEQAVKYALRTNQADIIAMPDVPELVRYDEDTNWVRSSPMKQSSTGDYVLYAQAAAVIEDERHRKEGAIAAISEMHDLASSHAASAEAAEAKLAQIEKQEPIGYVLAQKLAELANGADATICFIRAKQYAEKGTAIYTAPVASDADLRAEIERLRKSLEKIASLSHTTGLLWWQIEARVALNPSEPRT